ncbi:PKD domain-containing protein [Mariniflexile gromovii]|uniref:PKD domain-containing protein n=1 Tax=Mariniflexile gromovii TaxID=362523 RepID=A0ABS4BWE1_9FLAO|nr:PKD domain-containing protein [Mariniflexile gromovii]MBP0904905.1 PKD domain-containing protein [Mariniflexile gromovii]
MKTIINLKKYVSKVCFGALALIACVSVTSCDPTIDALAFDLPEANSKPDLTPPTANFKATVTLDYLTYNFSNISTSATDYLWDYGDGNTSTGVDGINTFPGEGTYKVTLTASDKLGQKSIFTMDIEVVEPDVPVILPPVLIFPDFENDAEKNEWKAPFKGTMQTTTSGGYYEGARGGKLPQDGSRAGYQEFDITPNANFVLRFKYRIRDREPLQTGEMYVRIVKPLTISSYDLAVIESNSIASATYVESDTTTGSLQDGAIFFNSGANTRLAILFHNELDECYIDSFKIEVNQ